MSDRPSVLVTFARPEESRTFRRLLAGLQRSRKGNIEFEIGKLGPTGIAVAHTGIGPESATATMERLLPANPWNHVIAAGFAGGLDPQFPLAGIIIENRPTPGPLRLISRPVPVESVEEKGRVFRETGAAAVDMETDAIAAVCQAARIPMTAVRAISDPANTALPVPFATWFDLKRQRPKPFSLLAFLATHPQHIRPFIGFVRTLGPVAKTLAEAVAQCLLVK